MNKETEKDTEPVKDRETELIKAGSFVVGGAVIGALVSNGGGLGIAAFGGAVGAPVWLAGALVGLAGYGAYKVYKSISKDDKEKGSD